MAFPTSPTHKQPRRVAVLDPSDYKLAFVPRSLHDPSKYIILPLPTLKPSFDIYSSDGPDPSEEDRYEIVWRGDENEVLNDSMSFRARIRFTERLGLWEGGVKRLLGRRWRCLWIGEMVHYVDVKQAKERMVAEKVVRLLSWERGDVGE